MARKSICLFLIFLQIFSLPFVASAESVAPTAIQKDGTVVDVRDPSSVGSEFDVSGGKWVLLPDGKQVWVMHVEGTPIAFTQEQYAELIKDNGVSGDRKYYAINTLSALDVVRKDFDRDMLLEKDFWINQGKIKIRENLSQEDFWKRTRASTHTIRNEIGALIVKQPAYKQLKGVDRLEFALAEGSAGRSAWRWNNTPNGVAGTTGHYLAQGAVHAKNSLKISLHPKNLLVTAGIVTGLEIGRQILNGEKPNLRGVVSLVTSSQFLGGLAGSTLGSAVGSFVAPALTAIPFAGGFLSAAAPIFGAIAGSMFGSEYGRTRSFKEALKGIDPFTVFGSGIGSVIGATLGSALGPLGAIAGGMIGSSVGNWVAGKLKTFFKNRKQKKELVVIKQDLVQNQVPEDYQGNAGALTQPEEASWDTYRAGEAMLDESTNKINQRVYLRLLEAQERYKKLVAAGDAEGAQEALQVVHELKGQFKQVKSLD